MKRFTVLAAVVVAALAVAAATRHPGIAMAIAADMPDKQALLAAMLLVVIVGAVVAGPYVKWRTRSHALVAAARAPPPS